MIFMPIIDKVLLYVINHLDYSGDMNIDYYYKEGLLYGAINNDKHICGSHHIKGDKQNKRYMPARFGNIFV